MPTPRSRLSKRSNGSETLERIKRWPSLKKKFAGKLVRIWSGEHLAFWGKDAAGYVINQHLAWVVTFEEALKHTLHCSYEKGIEFILHDSLHALYYDVATWEMILSEPTYQFRSRYAIGQEFVHNRKTWIVVNEWIDRGVYYVLCSHNIPAHLTMIMGKSNRS